MLDISEIFTINEALQPLIRQVDEFKDTLGLIIGEPESVSLNASPLRGGKTLSTGATRNGLQVFFCELGSTKPSQTGLPVCFFKHFILKVNLMANVDGFEVYIDRDNRYYIKTRIATKRPTYFQIPAITQVRVI